MHELYAQIGTSSVIVVSGCDTGIGRETAKFLAKLGFHVVVTVLNPEVCLGVAVAFVRALSRSISFVICSYVLA